MLLPAMWMGNVDFNTVDDVIAGKWLGTAFDVCIAQDIIDASVSDFANIGDVAVEV